MESFESVEILTELWTFAPVESFESVEFPTEEWRALNSRRILTELTTGAIFHYLFFYLACCKLLVVCNFKCLC